MSLGRSIILLLTGLLVGTGLIVGSVGYFTTKSSIESLRGELLAQVDARVQQRLQTYFDRAEPAIGFMERAVFNDPDFPANWKSQGLLLTEFLKTEPNIAWLYYADVSSGNLLGANRDPLERHVLTLVLEENGHQREGYQVQADGSTESVELIPANSNPYDPRSRPWFQRAVRDEGMIWTAPYEFLSSEVIGITAAKAVRDERGEILGVLAADVVLSQLGDFLDEFEVGGSGGAFLLLEDGSVVVPKEERKPAHVLKVQDALESAGLDFSGPIGEGTLEMEFTHEGENLVALIDELNLPGSIRYFAAVVVPEEAYLGVVTRNAWITFGVSLGILLLAIALGTWQARRVTTPLSLLGDELEQIGNLRFRDSGLEIRSKIREVALFSASVGKMKVTLRAFSRYVPRDLVRLLLARGDEARLGGSLRSVTVVFTDLAGFTSMSEQLSADEAFKELSVFLEIIAAAQEEFGGITSSFTGDGTLALFNAPEDLESHEEKACLSALKAAMELRRCNEQRRAEGKFEFKVRIGINTAEVLLGNLGTRERFAYTAIGDGVNLASRLEGLGKLYGIEILVGGDCRPERQKKIEWRRVDRISVVGRNQATEIFEPLGLKGEVSPSILDCRDRYEAALERYAAGNFPGALEGFREVARKWADDEPTRMMIARIESLVAQHPTGAPAGWDGIHEATSK